jgi:hypothetical protein
MYDGRMRLRTERTRGVGWLGALSVFVGACLGDPAPGARAPRPAATVDVPPPMADAGTASAAAHAVDAGAKVPDAGAHAWRNTASCAALQRSKALGCCNPSPEMLLCIVYSGANHVMGPYPARILLATATDTQRVVANIPIEVRDHASANATDATVGVLELSVQPWGFELAAQQGCGDDAKSGTKRMCGGLGKHVWDGSKLVHEPK